MKQIHVSAGFAWDGAEAESLRALRLRVFGLEQGIPPEEEFDEIDLTAWQVLVTDVVTGRALGTGRLFPFEGGGRIGRMAVSEAARGEGIGRLLIDVMLAEGRRRGWHRFVLDAQVQAIGFYQKCGFVVCGPEHLDCGIPHRLMEFRAAIPPISSRQRQR